MCQCLCITACVCVYGLLDLKQSINQSVCVGGGGGGGGGGVGGRCSSVVRRRDFKSTAKTARGFDPLVGQGEGQVVFVFFPLRVNSCADLFVFDSPSCQCTALAHPKLCAR